MSDDEEEPTPQSEPDPEIHPIDPDGPHWYVTRSALDAPPEKVTVPEAKTVIDDAVSTPALLWTGIKQLMAAAIVITKATSPMTATDATAPTTLPVESKPWYTSKTLWLNGLTFIWYFVGPMVGIPILTPEVTGVALTVANMLLRAVTKQPVSIS